MSKIICLLFKLLYALKMYMDFTEAAKGSGFMLTNMECESWDKEFVYFSLCQVEKRSQILSVLNARATLRKTASDIKANVKLLRKLNRNYQPFLYDDLIDVCGLLANMDDKRQIFWSSITPVITKHTNVNHSCPYYPQDIVAHNFSHDAGYASLLPIPKGKYRVQVIFWVNGVKRCKINVYSEKF
ncbi:uncharacterized protein LOC106085039 isoform X1 [Stomoxys calcitrans]|uniref:uncharacterized protein LOC106085039 isoform X1 n=1 Tax=Stomoxys calcitrans TaxID=35570 RepID=UPI0027E3063E|nr:uncharacterized protein LOC106085039 isoform X1 [Stomoxys calcitrans]